MPVEQQHSHIRAIQSTHHDGVEVPDFPRIEKIINILRRLPPGRLLDVGYSKGSFADFLAPIGWECTGLDVNEYHQPMVSTIQCDLNEGFPVDGKTYDVVTAGPRFAVSGQGGGVDGLGDEEDGLVSLPFSFAHRSAVKAVNRR